MIRQNHHGWWVDIRLQWNEGRFQRLVRSGRLRCVRGDGDLDEGSDTVHRSAENSLASIIRRDLSAPPVS